MSKRKDTKRQKSILNYFVSQSNIPKEEAHSPVTDSLEAMTLDTDTIPESHAMDKVELTQSDEEEEEEEIVISRKKKRKLKRRIEEESSASDNEEDSKPISVRLAELKQQHKEKQQFLKQDKVEQCDDRIIYDDELDYLDKTDILQERTRGRKVSRYTEALKKLANRKSKLDSYQGEQGPIERYATTNKDSSEEEEEENSGVDSSDNNNNSSDLEGFVVDDDIIDGEKNTAEASEMTMMEMPAEFTKARTHSFSKQLKVYLEYLIALSINPVFDISSHPQYQIAKNAVVRRVQSYKDSIVTSDVWLTSFKEAVDKYSKWSFLPSENINDDIWGSDLMTCEACRSNKPASEKVTLSSDDLSSSITFFLGSECCRKGELYHKLYHFELHMYNKVKSKVVTEMMMMSDRHLQLKDNNLQQQTSMIYYTLRKSGYLKKLRNGVLDLFNTVIFLYNLKNQRSRLVFDSSGSDSDSTSCNEYSSSEDD